MALVEEAHKQHLLHRSCRFLITHFYTVLLLQDHLEYVFLSIFTVEFVLKVLTKGFVMEQGTYLRDGWNVLDFIIVVIAYIEVMLVHIDGGADVPNVKILRCAVAIPPLSFS